MHHKLVNGAHFSLGSDLPFASICSLMGKWGRGWEFICRFARSVTFLRNFQCILIQTSFCWLRNYMMRPKYFYRMWCWVPFYSHGLLSSVQKARSEKCSLTFYIYIYIHISHLRLNHSWKLKFKISKCICYRVGDPQSLWDVEPSHPRDWSDFPFIYYVCVMESSLMLKVNNGL